MANTIVRYHALEGQTDFTIPCPYLEQSDIYVALNGTTLLNPLQYSIVNDTTVRLANPAHEGDSVIIQRRTESDNRLVDFQNGAVLTEEELDLAFLQNFYLIQELRDALNDVAAAAIVDVTPEQLEAIGNQILAQEVADQIQQRIADIDAAGQELLNHLAQLRAIGEPNDDFSRFKFNTTSIELNESGVTLEDYFGQLEAADSVLAERIELLGAVNGDGSAFILDLDTVYVGPSESLAQRLAAITADIGENTAMILAEQTTRADADNALAASISAVSAAVSDNTAMIVAEQTARADADNALASSISALSADVGANAAAIVAEQTARASGDSALASDISALQATVNDHTASITTLSSVQGSLVNDVAALEARYGVSLNVNGYITGFTQFNDGSSGTFAILADKFYIVDPANGGQNPVTVFGIQNGVVAMQNVVIGNALISDLTVDKLTTGILNADINVGNGKITWSNGTYMKVSGIGFGSENQFLEWYGPVMPITSCNELNGLVWLKTNGEAKFGGKLDTTVNVGFKPADFDGVYGYSTSNGIGAITPNMFKGWPIREAYWFNGSMGHGFVFAILTNFDVADDPPFKYLNVNGAVLARTSASYAFLSGTGVAQWTWNVASNPWSGSSGNRPMSIIH